MDCVPASRVVGDPQLHRWGKETFYTVTVEPEEWEAVEAWLKRLNYPYVPLQRKRDGVIIGKTVRFENRNLAMSLRLKFG